MFQPCMPAVVYSGEFVLRLCLLEAYKFIHICSLIEALLRQSNKYFLFFCFPHIGLMTRDLIQDPVAQSVMSLTADRGIASLIPAQSHTFLEIDHEIISMIILLLTLIQEGLLSVTSERMCTN